MNGRFTTSMIRMLAVCAAIPGLLALATGTGSAVSAQHASATLTINVYTCNSGYDPIDPHETLIDPCNLGTEDIAFTLEPLGRQSDSAMASTGTGGAPATISFSGLTAGDYRLTQQKSDAISLSYILQCTSNAREFDYPFSPFAIIEPGGRLGIHLLPGEQLTCDWYNVQTEPQETAALTITAYDCSGDTIGPDMCELTAGIEFELTDPTGVVAGQLVTGADGTASFDEAGVYQLTAASEVENRVFCAFEPYDLVVNDQLDLDPAHPIAIDAYYCYPGA